jgi:hypothetical protein
MSEYKFSDEIVSALSPDSRPILTGFPTLITHQEGMLRGYHKEKGAPLLERSSHPMENIRMSARQAYTMFLSKTIYYCRAIVDNTNSGNLLVAFQSMRALVEVVAAVRYTIEEVRPTVARCAERGTVTSDDAQRLNYRFDLLLHGEENYLNLGRRCLN